MSETDKAVDAGEVVETNHESASADRGGVTPSAVLPDEGPLFQRAPSTSAEVEQGKQIALSPDAVCEMYEGDWYSEGVLGCAA